MLVHALRTGQRGVALRLSSSLLHAVIACTVYTFPQTAFDLLLDVSNVGFLEVCLHELSLGLWAPFIFDPTGAAEHIKANHQELKQLESLLSAV